jgi:hypothetical protein
MRSGLSETPIYLFEKDTHTRAVCFYLNVVSSVCVCLLHLYKSQAKGTAGVLNYIIRCGAAEAHQNIYRQKLPAENKSGHHKNKLLL